METELSHVCGTKLDVAAPAARTTPSFTIAGSADSGTGLSKERLWSKRVAMPVAAQLGFDHQSPVAAALKLTLKSMIETIRQQTLSCFAFQQIQIDVRCLRDRLPWSMAAGHKGDLEALLDEVIASASERCVDSHAASSMNASQLEQILSQFQM
eukprot:TRINITY_DN3106_c0_g1_i2.p1 TRINITY_DN3106_c0_g1~~TRINITY_DN3106_c0_g1_i2.p1  ORF type:complete len:154 (+),score=31.84 TRINITY_DN3106_c0_g1_i2:40-501(+)